MQIMSISEAHEKLFDLPRHVVSEHEEIVVTHRDGNIVLISMDKWESYKETLRLLKDRSALHSLIESFENRDRGQSSGKSFEEVFSDLI
ncbi:MAG: type II toxin-antitoxin system Phd/YefM family antitoxin [Desulfococcaceae bacterium]